MVKKNLINWLGLLGIVSFISYAAAVVFFRLLIPAMTGKVKQSAI